MAPVAKKPPANAGDARDGGVKSGTRRRDLAKPHCGLHRASLMAKRPAQLSARTTPPAGKQKPGEAMAVSEDTGVDSHYSWPPFGGAAAEDLGHLIR